MPPASDPGEPLGGAGMGSALPPAALEGFTATRAETCQHGLKTPEESSLAFFQRALPEQEREKVLYK